VSFDVFFFGFLAGEAYEHGGSQMREVLAPHISEENPTFIRVRVGDGQADVYLGEGDMLANHISGRDPWDLLVKGAQAANWVIIPVGCPTCLTQPGQMEELPEGLDDNVVVVETGADLLAVIESC
jgi:hypothetical protein